MLPLTCRAWRAQPTARRRKGNQWIFIHGQVLLQQLAMAVKNYQLPNIGWECWCSPENYHSHGDFTMILDAQERNLSLGDTTGMSFLCVSSLQAMSLQHVQWMSGMCGSKVVTILEAPNDHPTWGQWHVYFFTWGLSQVFELFFGVWGSCWCMLGFVDLHLLKVDSCSTCLIHQI